MKNLKNEHGFTLIEMLIVLMVISVLIILIVPNLSDRSQNVNDTGCDALIALVQSQAEAYYLENGNYPENITTLVSADFITSDQTTCPNNDQLEISGGEVVTQ